ncbi:hypothetical protein HPB50_024768 [Hyalomma asiaticum]|uniref:Uncharacterized protein n=1 Tax=Hyalomma asiaticum TaxID=266040 RepID=A0ACB7TBT8_HYAAI|nr:hypothetical protein HPB50_024768 [Hyalomma asiaticum]
MLPHVMARHHPLWVKHRLHLVSQVVHLRGQGNLELQVSQGKVSLASRVRRNQDSQDNQADQTDCQDNQDRAVQVKGSQDDQGNQGDQVNLYQLHHQGKGNQVSQANRGKGHRANQDRHHPDKDNQVSQAKALLDRANQEDLAYSHVLKRDSSGILTAAIGFTAVLTLETDLLHTSLTAPKVSYLMSGTALATGPMPRLLATKSRHLVCLLLVVVGGLSLVPDSLRHILPDHHNRRHLLACLHSRRHRDRAQPKEQALQREPPLRGLQAP